MRFQYRTFGRCNAASHILAQPALTRGIRALEHELCAPLFVREARGMQLTAAGTLFHQRAGAVVNDLRRARDEIGQSQGSTQGSVTAGLSLAGAEWATTSIDYNAADALNALFARYKMGEAKLQLQAHSALTVIVSIASSDLLAIMPVQWNEFPLVRGTLQVIDLNERLPAPSIVCIRRPDLPLTPAADHFCDLLRRCPAKPSPRLAARASTGTRRVDQT